MAAPSPSLDMTAEPDRFDEAIAEFSKRRVITKAEADAMVAYSRRRAWWIAGVAQMDVANDVHSSIKDAMDRGIPFEEWKKAVEPKLTDAWGRENSPRVQLIFRNATMQAANSGRWDQMHDPAVLQVRPYLQYDAVRDSRECDRCEACNGVTLPADDPWWLTHSPILHHACRCGLRNKRVEFGKKHLTKTPPTVKADEGFGVPPTRSVPPVPTERKVKPAPAIHAEFTQKTFKDARERKPKLPKINPMHTPEFWESKYSHYGEARKQVAYGRALFELAKEMSHDEALAILKEATAREVPGVGQSGVDALGIFSDWEKSHPMVRASRKAAYDGQKLLAQMLKVSGRSAVPEPADLADASVATVQREAAAFYRAFASEKLLMPEGISWKALPAGGRAYYEGRAVHVDPLAVQATGIAVHEWGHAIEDGNAHLRAAVTAFKAYRERNDTPERLLDLLGGNYRDDELTKPDEYFTAYVGKIYPDASELLSSLFEWIASGSTAYLNVHDQESLLFGIGVLAGI